MNINLDIPEWFLVTMIVLIGIKIVIEAINIYLTWKNF